MYIELIIGNFVNKREQNQQRKPQIQQRKPQSQPQIKPQIKPPTQNSIINEQDTINNFLNETNLFTNNQNQLCNELNKISDINLLILLFSLRTIFTENQLINYIKKLNVNFKSKQLNKIRSKRFEDLIFITVIFAEYSKPQNDPELTNLIGSFVINNYNMDLINKLKTIEKFNNINYDEFKILFKFMIFSLNENDIIILINGLYDDSDKLNNNFKLMLKRWIK